MPIAVAWQAELGSEGWVVGLDDHELCGGGMRLAGQRGVAADSRDGRLPPVWRWAADGDGWVHAKRKK